MFSLKPRIKPPARRSGAKHKFIIRRDSDGWHWLLISSNGRFIAESDRYVRKHEARESIKRLPKFINSAVVVDED